MTHPVSERSAIIDIGSNSVRLVIFDVMGASALPTFNEKVMAGLGEGLVQTGHLSVDGVEAALDALSRYRAILKALGLKNFSAVATAAAREATDGPQFLKQASKALGRPVRLLSGADEARLSTIGVESNFHKPKGLVGDLGGSSLELKQLGEPRKSGESLLLGPLSLARGKFEEKSIRKHIRRELAGSGVLSDASGRFYAVGGSWRSLAKLHMEIDGYALKVLHGYTMNKRQVARAVKLCLDSVSNSAVRATLEKVDKKRAAILPIAAVMLEEILDASELDGVTISSSGVREGVLNDMIGMPNHDALLDGVIAFARLDHTQIGFGKALYEFASPAFEPEPDLLGSPAADARVERAACMMADSAGRFHPDHRSKTAYDQALRAPFAGVTHAERAMIAYAVGCRYSRHFKRPSEYLSLTTDEESTRAKQLGSVMRLGAVFSGRSGPILKRATLARRSKHLELRVKQSDAALVSETVKRRLAQTANLLQINPKVVIG